jgi:phosphoglycerate dehydrogenase-like enzyme
MNKILVTDSLFIKDEHAKKLEEAGFEVERLDKPNASEEELCQAVKGKVGYILGGTEKVTEKVIESADQLKVIVFTGTGWTGFIPAHEAASKKGIAIGAAPHLNAHAVAEFGMAMTLLMCRDMLDLARGWI